MNPIYTALKGKGFGNFVRRSARIAGRYGITADKMDRALARFGAVLERFQCGATLPITSVALQRNLRTIRKYLDRNIEFAIHGYRHVDHSQLSRAEQVVQLALARQVFVRAGIHPQGFRCPYLRGNPDTWKSLRQHGFTYDSSQGVAWDVVDGCQTSAYDHVLNFYGAEPACSIPAVPRIQDQLVRIPYSLPDDEALIERLDLETAEQMSALWLAILDRTWQRGELFTLGLHPERIDLCQDSLVAVLSRARALVPAVWIARLDEIAAWWHGRTMAAVEVRKIDGGAENRFALRLSVDGPPGTTILARGVDVVGPAEPWADGYVQIRGDTVVIASCAQRPFIGVSPDTSPAVTYFLRQQGYIVERTADERSHACYIDLPNPTPVWESSLLSQIEDSDLALVRLARWPNGARSALAVTGDIDALTLWDYGLRIWGA